MNNQAERVRCEQYQAAVDALLRIADSDPGPAYHIAKATLAEIQAKSDGPFDPFERAKQIRRGEIDDEIPHYEELTGWFQRVSISQLPGLLASLVQVCTARGVFQEGKLVPYVQRAEEMTGNYLRAAQDESGPLKQLDPDLAERVKAFFPAKTVEIGPVDMPEFKRE